MGNLFSKPKVTKAPAVKPVAPPATESAEQAGEAVRKRPLTGRAATFLTGDLVPEKTKKAKLG
jgi:hypothetical protein